MFNGIGTLSDRELRRIADELERSGFGRIEPPWELPDLRRGSGGWVWSDYSPAALQRRTQQVYRGALDAYAELVDQYFPAWRPTLGMAAWMPLCLQGTLKPTTGDAYGDCPGLLWSVLPLEPGSANRVDIQLGEPVRIWPGGRDAFVAWERPRRVALQRWRPEVLPYVRFFQQDGVLDVFGSRPATLLAYDWLSQDLYELGWLKARVSHHVQD